MPKSNPRSLPPPFLARSEQVAADSRRARHWAAASWSLNQNGIAKNGFVVGSPCCHHSTELNLWLVRPVIFYRSLTDLPKIFLIFSENIFFFKLITDGGPSNKNWPPSMKVKSWKSFGAKWAANGLVWMPQALKTPFLIQFWSWMNLPFPLLALWG